MKRALVDPTLDLPGIYARLARDLGFPAYFGNNLDALWDVLTTDIAGPVEIVWHGADMSCVRLGPSCRKLIATLRDVERARPDFRLRLL
ncbi:MAG: barstar family protein [Proteobacteria bacterium]|nr:barstar family protein [Pseudomonadota bacterium]